MQRTRRPGGHLDREASAMKASEPRGGAIWMDSGQAQAEDEKREPQTSVRPRCSNCETLGSQKPSLLGLQFQSELDLWDLGGNSELFAAALGNLEWLRFCLNCSRSGIVTDSKGFSALHFAAKTCKLDCMQVLIEEYGFPVDLRTNKGQTPLHLVIHRDNKLIALPCIYYLLGNGATLNCQTSNGSTPLHLAAREGLMNIVEVLVRNGANVHAQDTRGYKAIDYCKIWNDRPCARFLKDAMWRQDKKNVSREMVKLKQLKDQLTLMEQNFLIEYEKSHQMWIEEDFKTWLRLKLRRPEPAPVCRVPNLAWHTLGHARILPPLSIHCSREAKRLLAQLEPPREVSKHRLSQPQASRPRAWDPSTNPARSPITQISRPQDIRLGVQPDPNPERDLSCFLEVITTGQPGEERLLTRTGHKVAHLPQLPFQVILGALCPSQQPSRMKVPEGLRATSLSLMPRKWHRADAFCTDTLAMTLRETFEDAFVAAVRAHQGSPTLTSPQEPS